jgi:glyoxylase-like metal-dependent hydrolase (beta-lactamase superfamily II)
MQVTPAIHVLRHPFTVPIAPDIALDRFVYSYVIAGETITLIDTGVAGSENAIFSYLRSIGRDPREITLIILTHSHPDHIGAAKAIRDQTGCTVMAHPAVRGWIEDVEIQNRERPVPGFSSLVGGSVTVDHELEDGDVIDPDGTGTNEIQVLHTPGHSAGSLSLLLPAEGALFSGDAIPVYGDLPVYDYAGRSARSVKRLRAIRNLRVLLSAWDEPRTGDAVYEQMDRALAYLQESHDAVLAVSADGTTDPMEIAGRAAARLGLPMQAVSPLLARTFTENLKIRNQKNPADGA